MLYISGYQLVLAWHSELLLSNLIQTKNMLLNIFFLNKSSEPYIIHSVVNLNKL